MQTYYLLGNHGFYNFQRAALLQAYAIPGAAPDGGAYHATSPAPGVRLVFLDSYALSAIGWPEGDPRRLEGQALLDKHNAAPHGRQNSPAKRARGAARRWVALGGGLGGAQLGWLDRTLSAARAAGERALVFSHIPLHLGATSALCGGMCVAWDYQDALAVLRRHGGTVAACFAGHDHSGGAVTDAASGVHFLTLQGIIETPSHVSGAHGTLALHARELVLRGKGRMASRALRLPPLPPPH
jgi:manganese-dependent ADP-ribose/CDP-alcohol diphosphatase